MVLWMLGASFVLTEPGMSNLWNFRALGAPPIFHLASFGFCQFMFFLGATVVLPTKVFDPVYIMETIEKEKINALVLVPAMTFFVLLTPIWRSTIPVHCRSGAPLEPFCRLRRANKVKKVFPNVKIFDLFGQTEMSALVAGSCPVSPRTRDLGGQDTALHRDARRRRR